MAEELKEDNTESDHWMQTKWRPAMGWMYMVVCSFDFVVAPIMWSVLQAISKGIVSEQWVPLTLQGAGLFHLAMGAVLGIAAFGRTQEKIAGTTNNSTIENPTSSILNTLKTKPVPKAVLDSNDPPARNTRND
jgi:uncharacterized membrane protein YvlD (DUF360 family)